MNKLLIFSFLLFLSCNLAIQEKENYDVSEIKKAVDTTLNQWHKAAAEADFDTYFGLMDEQAVFVGTDSSEVWRKKEFMAFSKPYFDKGKAWNFQKINRNIYTDNNFPHVVWFDETLQTWMGICRGSGVMTQNNGQWKIRHYVLSLTVPNNKIQKVMEAIAGH